MSKKVLAAFAALTLMTVVPQALAQQEKTKQDQAARDRQLEDCVKTCKAKGQTLCNKQCRAQLSCAPGRGKC